MGKMATLLLGVPRGHYEMLADLVREGFYPSINEAIRMAIRDLLKEHKKI